MRPLNECEQQRDTEAAWDIKVSEEKQLPVPNRRGTLDEQRRSLEVLAEGQGKVIMLKNKYRFGMADQSTFDNEQDNYTSRLRCKSAVKLQTTSKKVLGNVGGQRSMYRSYSIAPE